MENKVLPKVLSISLSTWNRKSGIHTQTDLFKYWQSDRVAQIYLKSDKPDTDVCNKFFQISENEIIHSVMNRRVVGIETFNCENVDTKAIEEEKRLYTRAHKKKSWFLTLMREIVWDLGRWKSDNLKQFVENFNADVYFVPIYPVIYTAKIQRYILKKWPKPYVCYLADDNYSYDSCGNNIFAYIHRYFLRKQVKFLAKNCDEMFTITKMEAEETDQLFGTNSVILTKGLDYSNKTYIPFKAHNPVKMVYTGNLHIGRDSSLVKISNAMKIINKDDTKVTFDIYSPTQLSEDTMHILNSNGCKFCGCVSKEKVEEIQSNADIVVFVESLEKKFKNIARMSFSTKLTDYFYSGKCIFAIGDENIAPINYLLENDAAVVAKKDEEILQELSDLINSEDKILNYSKKSYECGLKNHNEIDVKKRFIDTMCRAINH